MVDKYCFFPQPETTQVNAPGWMASKVVVERTKQNKNHVMRNVTMTRRKYDQTKHVSNSRLALCSLPGPVPNEYTINALQQILLFSLHVFPKAFNALGPPVPPLINGLPRISFAIRSQQRSIPPPKPCGMSSNPKLFSAPSTSSIGPIGLSLLLVWDVSDRTGIRPASE